ncbi:MAG: phenylalanine--tRNA ligase subunit beta, partial [Verrucomicrobiales bacterium]
MNTSLNWLQDHLDLSDCKTDELADMLTFAGIEVEGIETRGAGVDHVVVGQIKSSDPHPNAERLSICQVDDGSGSPRQIVCGAKNYQVGDKVPVALPGAVLPGDFKIKEGQLRGVDSNGMMCSGRELGLSEDHEGLLILKTDANTGTPIGDLYESDTLFELEITPNRPDCLSHLGVARELAALTKRPLKGTSHHGETTISQQAAKPEQITLATEACPFYSARRISGVQVGPSPDWLKLKLESIGLRPINNVVDITNYVLFEMGQPLHAFDADKLDGGIHVRSANEGENFLALDGNEYALQTEDMVISDQSKALAIGGVMGGEDSGVIEGTTNILLESAYFNPSRIRRTSRRLDLSSDSSYRFERGIDPAQTVGASELATKLILELAGGTAEDVLLVAGEIPAPPNPVNLDHARAARLLGADLSLEDMGAILTGLGLESTADGAWKIPTFRGDLERHVDLVEEITRVYGIDKIPSREQAFFAEPTKEDARYDAHLQLRQRLVSLGYDDCLTIKLIADGQLEDDLCSLRLGKQTQAVRLKKPLSQDHT